MNFVESARAAEVPSRRDHHMIASSELGGIMIGLEFYSESTVVKPYFEELREKEEAAGGSGWHLY